MSIPIGTVLRALIAVALALAAPAAGQAISEPDPATHPPELVSGLNNGLRKILLRIEVPEHGHPICDLRFRSLDQDLLLEERFVHHVAPERLAWQGARTVEKDGDQWTEYVWRAGSGLRVRVAHPVRKLGEPFLAHFARLGFDVAADRLPHALLILESQDYETPFPLRDLSGFEDPLEALRLDRVPLEKSALRHEVVVFLLKKADGGDRRQKLEAIEQMQNFSNEEIAILEPRLLALRESEDAEVAAAARRFCRQRGLYSQEEVEAACRDLAGEDLTRARKALVLLREVGPRAARDGIPAVRTFLARRDLGEPERGLAEGVLRRLQGRTPASRPTPSPEEGSGGPR